jgi:hypothetical protein
VVQARLASDDSPESPNAFAWRLVGAQRFTRPQNEYMRVITCESYPFEATYKNPESAIAGGRNHPLQPKARADTEILAGSCIIDAFWTDTNFVLQFSNGKLLHVFLYGNRVAWEISDTPPTLVETALERIGADAVICRWGPEVGEGIMDRSGLIQSRRGKSFRMLFVNEGLWLYCRGMEILYFAAVRSVEADGPFLYVSELN